MCALLLDQTSRVNAAFTSCLRLLEDKSYAAAAAHCRQVFEESGRLEAGVAAARAQAAFRQPDLVLPWLQRLKGTPVESVLWGVVTRVYQDRGEITAAIQTAERKLDLERRAGDHRNAARSAYGLFFLSWRKSKYRESLEFARQAWEEASKAGDHAAQLLALQGLVTVFFEVGDLDTTGRLLDEAEPLMGPRDTMERARLLVFRGLIQLNRARPALARDALESALGVAPRSGDRLFFRSTHLNLVNTYLTLGDVDQAERHLEAAWTYVEPDGRNQAALLYYRARVHHARGRYRQSADAARTALDQKPSPAWTWDLEYQRGQSEESLSNLEVAEAAYQHSTEVVEQTRRSLGLDHLKSWLIDERRQPFEALFLLQARAGRGKDALKTVERSKAGAFLDALVSAAMTSEADRPAGIHGLASAGRLDDLLSLLPPMEDSQVATLPSIDRVVRALGDRQTLVYFEAEEELWLLTVARGRVGLRRLGESRHVARDLVTRFLSQPDDEAAASALGALLLPDRALPRPGSVLHIVTDGVLGEVPFSALRRHGRYLVQDHALAYVPSVTAMITADARPPVRRGPAFVIGDPRGDLPVAAREAERVASRLRVTARTHQAATTAALREAAHASVLHLAAHTGLGPRGPWLALADRAVDTSDVIEWQLRPGLVVLATCASGARRSKGLLGSLGASFLVAGSPAVLASLWSVEDRAAWDLVNRFYDDPGADVHPARSLALAQRRLIGEGRPPSSWAAFVVFGVERLLQ